MRITESAIRRIIREELLEEDLQSFLDASRDISYSASGHDPHFTGQDKPLKDKARAVKRLWMQHSDQKGLQQVVDLVFMLGVEQYIVYIYHSYNRLSNKEAWVQLRGLEAFSL